MKPPLQACFSRRTVLEIIFWERLRNRKPLKLIWDRTAHLAELTLSHSCIIPISARKKMYYANQVSKILGAFFLVPSHIFFKTLMYFSRRTQKRETYVLKRWKSKVLYIPQIADSILSIYRRKTKSYLFKAKNTIDEPCTGFKPSFSKKVLSRKQNCIALSKENLSQKVRFSKNCTWNLIKNVCFFHDQRRYTHLVYAMWKTRRK